MSQLLLPSSIVECSFCNSNVAISNIVEHFSQFHQWTINTNVHLFHRCLLNKCTSSSEMFSYRLLFQHIREIHYCPIPQYLNRRFQSNDISTNNLNTINSSVEVNISTIIDVAVSKYLETSDYNLKSILALEKLLFEIFEKTNSSKLIMGLNESTIFDKIKSTNIKGICVATTAEIVPRRKIRPEPSMIYHINIKLDIERYLKKITVVYPQIENSIKCAEKLEVIIYMDDIVLGNVLGSGAKNNSYCHFAYRIYLQEVEKSSSLYHYRSVGVIKTKYVKNNEYNDVAKVITKLFSNTQISYKDIQLSVAVKFITGDNLALHTLFNVTRNFNATGTNNCRVCKFGGRNWSRYITCSSLQPFLRSHHTISFLPQNNHFILDGFHDLQLGVLQHMLYAGNLYLQLTTNLSPESIRDSILIHSTHLGKIDVIRSVLTRNFFKIENIRSLREINATNFKKESLKLNGSQTLVTLRCFYEYISELIPRLNIQLAEKNVLENIRSLLKSSLNMAYLTYERNLSLEEISQHFEKNSEHLLEGIKKVFKGRFRLSLKYHNLLHYKDMIQSLKIKPYWSMCSRFESSNYKLKKILNTTNSRINPSFTILKRIEIMNIIEDTCHPISSSEEDVANEWDYEILEIRDEAIQRDEVNILISSELNSFSELM